MKELHRPIRIGKLELRNRVVMPPMATAKSSETGMVTDEVIEWYKERAKNDRIGLIITEHSYVSRQGIARENQLSIASDDCIEGLRRLTDTIHSYGTMTIAQLNHAGAVAATQLTGLAAVAPSSVYPPGRANSNEMPLQFTEEGIRQLTSDFAKAAARAKAAGYDGVEIHSAHGYLYNQFYSPLTNHRTDSYGGTLQNRMRALMEAVQAVRSAVGNDYPISVRLGGCDYMEGGSSIADSVEAAKMLAGAGIDLLSVTGGLCRYIREGHTEPGYFQDMSIDIKKQVKVPVLLTGGIKTVDEAEELIMSQAADLIGIGRELMRNPNWPVEQSADLKVGSLS